MSSSDAEPIQSILLHMLSEQSRAFVTLLHSVALTIRTVPAEPLMTDECVFTMHVYGCMAVPEWM